MRQLLVILTICLIALSGGLGMLIAAPDDSIGGFDPHHPATLLPIVAAGFWECHSLVREWVDTTLGELRDVLQRKHLIESLPR